MPRPSFLRRGHNVDAKAYCDGMAAVGNLAGLEQNAGELGAVGQDVIGPFERNAGIAAERIGSVYADLDQAAGQNGR